jgi:O-antigen/teichoic acid export membrane protein
MVPWLVRTVIKVPPALRSETTTSFYLLGLAIPIVVLTTGFRGLLEAAQQFKLTSFVKIPLGVLMFLTPLWVLRFTQNLAVIILTLVFVRLAGAVAYAIMCHRVVHRHGIPLRLDRRAARTLLGFGAWMTVSNIVSPLMVSVDRFVVGALLSVAAVAYYATPFEAVTKLLIVPGAIAAVLFPAFSAASTIDRPRIVRLFRAGLWAVFLTMYAVTFVTITFAPELLSLWLGPAFAVQSTSALRWLAVGVLTNSLASVPFALLQGVGRSDITAKIHVAEAPLYFILMVWLIQEFGITTLDMSLLYWFASRNLPSTGSVSRRDMAIIVALTPALGVGLIVHAPLQKAFVTLILAALFCLLGWHFTRQGDRRLQIRRLLGAIAP